MTQDDKIMLALAALTYRGFGHHSEAAVDKALRPWLPQLDAEGLGKWDLVWGPATFRAPTSLVDDAMVYVVKQDNPSGERPRYAVAVRGTNPISVFDWVFGDLWVRLQMDWPAATASQAQISASTALGLAIIQHLAAEVPPSTAGNLAMLANTVASALGEFMLALPELEPERLLMDPTSLPDDRLIARINLLSGALTEHSNAIRARVFGLLDRFVDLQTLEGGMERRVLDGLLRHIASVQGRGETLVQFLSRRVEQNAVVAITGHSKGGALAIATALWLDENWAASRQVQIDCFSFAGPTSGNAAFAQYYNSRLAARTRRIVNRRDIVPQAWVPQTLRTVPEFYPLLAPAVNALMSLITPLAQTHVGGEVVEIASKATPGTLAQQIAHQHLDAYLIDAGFPTPKWTARSLFLSV